MSIRLKDMVKVLMVGSVLGALLVGCGVKSDLPDVGNVAALYTDVSPEFEDIEGDTDDVAEDDDLNVLLGQIVNRYLIPHSYTKSDVDGEIMYHKYDGDFSIRVGILESPTAGDQDPDLGINLIFSQRSHIHPKEIAVVASEYLDVLFDMFDIKKAKDRQRVTDELLVGLNKHTTLKLEMSEHRSSVETEDLKFTIDIVTFNKGASENDSIDESGDIEYNISFRDIMYR